MPVSVMTSQGSKEMAHNLDDLRERWLSRKTGSPARELGKEILTLADEEISEFAAKLSRRECHQVIMEVKSIQKDIKRQLHRRQRELKSRWGFSAIHKRDRCDTAIKCITQSMPTKKHGPMWYYVKLVKKHISAELSESLWEEARALSDEDDE